MHRTNLEESYLWHKMNDTHLNVGGSGQGMPYGFFGYERVLEEEMIILEAWILEGALPD